MTTKKTGKTTTLKFRINEQRGSEHDEIEEYLSFINALTKEFIPYSVNRIMFINHDNDDYIWGVTFASSDYELIREKLL